VVIMREPPRIANQQCGVFSTAQALAAKWTPAALRRATDRGQLIRLRNGAYQTTDLDHLDEYERARWHHAAPAIGAVLMTPGALASHSTAAVLRGVPLLFVPERPCVSVVPWHTGEILRTHVHRCTSAPMSLPVGGVECTSQERMAIDLAREHGVIAGTIALDYLLHQEQTCPAKLDEELVRCSRWPGVRAARTAVDLADGLSESPLETRSRLKFRSAGLPTPTLQARIADERGRFLGRADFYWDEYGVVGEADGAKKYDGSDPPPLLKEKLRQELFANTGLEVARWGSADLSPFDPLDERIRRALARGSRRSPEDRRWRILPPTNPRL
jgi:Transcriptional regulator, AbiEi antitoxin